MGIWLSSSMVRSSLFALLIGCFLWSGCGGGDTGSSGDGSPFPAKMLSWSPPSSYTDGTPLSPLTDLDSHEIYVNETGTFVDTDLPMAVVRATDPGTGQVTTSFDLANLGLYLSKGVLYRVSLRTVSITGLKSDFSQSASFSF